MEVFFVSRRVFFSFHYKYIWKVNQIRGIPNISSTAAAGFQDASLWEKAMKIGDKEVKKMIDQALDDTSVTVVCVTCGTTARKYINYEIEKSLERGNGLVAVQIHHLRDQSGETGVPGAIPPQIKANGFKTYKYTDKEALACWIEEAAGIVGK